ncbi:MAG: hypothetical protein AVDCRST_MAG71-450 [uncultured Lysobacter sp.]|uniref:DUF2939 domain-containing protein n=1 Tax=uncultured Lysobacter sp. TaxID=271060 RepID=A0A6J4KK17_9GAMM|nr:MAG: hypothetical protein AVDCRST_MAG71-450 [uncultured Lysobacter sp.]
MKKWIALLVIGALAFAAYIAAGPILALNSIRDAIQREDTAAIARHVDFPAVRVNLRAQIDDYLARRAGPDGQADVFGALAVRLAGAAAGSVADVLATPAGIGVVLEGRGLIHRITGEGVSAIDTYRHQPPTDLLERATYRYESHDRFAVTVPNRDGAPVVFVLTRNGLQWKITEVRMPLESLDPTRWNEAPGG